MQAELGCRERETVSESSLSAHETYRCAVHRASNIVSMRRRSLLNHDKYSRNVVVMAIKNPIPFLISFGSSVVLLPCDDHNEPMINCSTALARISPDHGNWAVEQKIWQSRREIEK